MKHNLIKGIRQIAQKYTTFFFDMDGVIWNGPKMIEGSIQVLKFLQEQNKKIIFLTNSSSKSVYQIWKRLQDNGFEIDITSIYTSNRVLGIYIKQNHPEIKNIFIIGNRFMKQQLDNVGLNCILSQDDGKNMNLYQFKHLIEQMDNDVHAVASGFDYQMNYKKLCKISIYIQKGRKWFATGADKYIMSQGLKLPGAGTIVKQISTATDTQPTIVGKPNPYIINHLIKDFNLNPKQCVMTGDNIYTDILIGINSNVDTVCVMTGVTKWESTSQGPQATYYTDRL